MAPKKRRKRGRPRKKGVNRTPTGQISRANDDPNVRSVALAYRQKHYGLSDGLNTEQQRAASSEVGRLWLAGRIDEAMFKAAEAYLGIYEAMSWAVQTPADLALRKPPASPLWHKPRSDDDYLEWAIGAVARWRVFRVRSEVIQRLVLDDMPVTTEQLIEARVYLSALAKHLGVEAQMMAS